MTLPKFLMEIETHISKYPKPRKILTSNVIKIKTKFNKQNTCMKKKTLNMKKTALGNKSQEKIIYHHTAIFGFKIFLVFLLK